MNSTPIRNRSRIAIQGLLGALLLVLATAGSPAGATTYQPVSDEALARQAELVLEGSVVSSYGVETLPFPSTEYVVLPSRVLKGEVADSTLIVRVLGGTSPSGERFEVAGAPRLREGAEVILFLSRLSDGAWSPLHLGLGVFEGQGWGGDRVARRNLDDEMGSENGRVRDYERFAQWIEDRSRGMRRTADYYRPADEVARFEAAYTLEKHNEMNVRWFEFDAGKSLPWKISGSTSTLQEKALRAALEAWSSVKGPDVRMQFAGTTSSRNGFQTMDWENTVLFGDPNELIAGRFDCATGGIAALGGWWSDESMDTYEGESYYRILEGDVVVNDGVECFLNSDPKRAEEMLTHEIGHALGLGHSCGDTVTGPCNDPKLEDAIMKARHHDDSRGARLSRDDREALAELYGDLEIEDLAAPTDLKAKLKGKASKVLLTWTDNSEQEAGFEIYRRVGRGDWELWKTAPGDRGRLKARVDVEGRGKVLYRARAISDMTESPYSNLAKVRIK